MYLQEVYSLNRGMSSAHISNTMQNRMKGTAQCHLLIKEGVNASQWLNERKLTSSNVGEDMEQLELSLLVEM